MTLPCGNARLRSFGRVGVVASILVLAAMGQPVAAMGAEPAPDEAAWLFDPNAVVEIDLGLSAEEIEALEADPDEYQPGTFELRVDGVPQGSPLGEIGIRLKGGLGSFRPLSKKAAFKIKFDEYVDDQTFFGLEKLTLNNMVQDPSMVHESLTYELFHALGMPASRTGYAFVRVNDLVYGLYLNIETLDEVSLPRWFESTAHLYEADVPGVDVRPGGAEDFEVDEGDDEDLADLEALIAAANVETGDWSDGMAAVADLEQMTRLWAVERYVGHWDGYAGQADPADLTPNNYYLHSDGTGVFRMLPWGTDQTWIEHLEFGEPAGGLLFNRCLADQSCEALYADALEEVHAALGGLELGKHAAELLKLLAPYRALETAPQLEETPAEVAASLEATCAFISERPVELGGWLVATGRGPLSLQLEPSCHTPVARVAGSLRPVPMETIIQPNPGLWIGRSRLTGNSVATSFVLPGPGRVRQLVTARLGKRRRAVCAAQRDVAAAGFAELRCQLSAGTRRQLGSGSLPLLVTVSFRPLGGDPDVRRRRLVVPQRPWSR
jgi:CotH protein